MEQDETTNSSLRLFRNRAKDARIYSLPSSNGDAALIVGDFSSMEAKRDLVVKKMYGDLYRIHETHTAYLPLQYPMIFPCGEDGYQNDIPIRDSIDGQKSRQRKRVALREFIAFRIQERDVEFGNCQLQEIISAICS